MSLLIGVCLSGRQHNKYYVVLTQESCIILSHNTTFFNYQKWQQTCCLCMRSVIRLYIPHGICERNSYVILTHSPKAAPLQHNIYYVVLIFLPIYPLISHISAHASYSFHPCKTGIPACTPVSSCLPPVKLLTFLMLPHCWQAGLYNQKLYARSYASGLNVLCVLGLWI